MNPYSRLRAHLAARRARQEAEREASRMRFRDNMIQMIGEAAREYERRQAATPAAPLHAEQSGDRGE